MKKSKFTDAQIVKILRESDVTSGEEVPMLRGFPHWVFSVAVSPDGNTVATGGTDGSVQLMYSSTTHGGLMGVRSLIGSEPSQNTGLFARESRTASSNGLSASNE